MNENVCDLLQQPGGWELRCHCRLCAGNARGGGSDPLRFSVHGCGACHCECFRQREACPYFADDAFRLNEAAALADRAVFIVPNYCDFPCSNFFLFNERSQCCFNGHAELADRYLAVPKKFIVVSNTGRENFLAAFRDHVLPKTEPDVCFLRAAAYHRISLDGDLMTCEPARAAVREFLRDW